MVLDNNVYSVESLNVNQIEVIQNSCRCNVKCIERDDFKNHVDMHKQIGVLICRDRDPIDFYLDLCENLKFIFIVSTGVEKLPFKRLIERNITVCNTSGANANIMSEYAMGYILSQSVRIIENFCNQQRSIWKKFQCVDSLYGKNLLIVGAGHTGQLLAKKAKSFGMKVVGVKRRCCDLDNFDQIISLNDISSHLQNSDFVVCCIPLTPETQGLFNYDFFSKMKRSSVFINISRGKVIVQDDLIRALNDKLIKMAILDVFNEEPLSSNDSIWKIDNLLISPHSSGRLENFMDVATDKFVDNYLAYKNGLELPNVVNLEHGY